MEETPEAKSKRLSRKTQSAMPTRPDLVIESPKNPRVREWKNLHTARGRGETGLFLAEGPHLVEEAGRAGCLVEVLAVDEAAVPRGVPMVRVSEAVLRAVAETPSPQGVVGVCRRSLLPRATPAGHWLLLDGVQDPGNVGTMIRTAHAAGFTGVGLGAGTADALSGKAIRAGQGSLFHVGLRSAPLPDLIGELQHGGHRVIGTALAPGSRDHRLLSALDVPVALVVGNEGAGVSPSVLAHCDEIVHIPMPGGAESLSVPVAAGILMFELTRPRHSIG